KAGDGTLAPLVEHWNGSAFKLVRLPSGLNKGFGLHAIEGQGGQDFWAVGSSGVTLQRSGTSWTRHHIPGASSNDTLYGVSEPAADDAWTVGVTDDGTSAAVLLYHWNGSAWSSQGPSLLGYLYGVRAVSPSNVWAVGTQLVNNDFRALVLH